MKIEMRECNSFGNGLLQDLCHYTDVSKWIEDIVDITQAIKTMETPTKNLNFLPLNLLVQVDGKTYKIIKGTFIDEKELKVIKKIKRLPRTMRMMPNDGLVIIANIFERDLYIEIK